MFHQLNELDSEEHLVRVLGVALNGFITIERINKLIPYERVDKIDEEVRKYFNIVNTVLENAKEKTRN